MPECDPRRGRGVLGARGAKPQAQRIQARITSVTDGDTIRVRAYGAGRNSYRVRLIGIDTPETSPQECGAEEATDAMLRLSFTAPQDTDGDGLVDEEGGIGRRAVLITDPTQRVFDRYDRLLAYVRTRPGINLGLRQLSAGWGRVVRLRPPVPGVPALPQRG